LAERQPNTPGCYRITPLPLNDPREALLARLALADAAERTIDVEPA